MPCHASTFWTPFSKLCRPTVLQKHVKTRPQEIVDSWHVFHDVWVDRGFKTLSLNREKSSISPPFLKLCQPNGVQKHVETRRKEIVKFWHAFHDVRVDRRFKTRFLNREKSSILERPFDDVRVDRSSNARSQNREKSSILERPFHNVRVDKGFKIKTRA